MGEKRKKYPQKSESQKLMAYSQETVIVIGKETVWFLAECFLFLSSAVLTLKVV